MSNGTVEPAEAPVPAPAALVRDFVNTEDHELDTDELSSAAALAEWLRGRGRGLGPVRVRGGDLELARELRAGLRRALEQNHDGSSGVPAGLDEVVARLPVGLGWDDHGPVLVPGRGAAGALAHVVVAALEAARSGTWERLKICAADDCAWAYFDHSRNRSRNWCEFGCGNKAKTRAYRERLRAGGR